MTLTLEQVRQTRFHLARRNGYEPVDVDNFVDKVEATLSQLAEENETLKQQIDALGSSEPSSIFVPGDSSEADHFKEQLASRQGELDSARGELDGLRAHVENQARELERLQAELGAKQSEIDAVRGELEALKAPQSTDGEPKARVENIVVTSSADASPAVTRLLQMATEQAERLVGESQAEAQRVVSEARAEAEGLIDSANRKAHETLTDARTRAERVESEARVNADRVTNEAQARADGLNTEVDHRRAELFGELESERDTLRGKVDHLRSFEGSFRSNLTTHLQNQINVLNGAVLEPGEVPDILNEPGVGSATPRLDALLGDQG